MYFSAFSWRRCTSRMHYGTFWSTAWRRRPWARRSPPVSRATATWGRNVPGAASWPNGGRPRSRFRRFLADCHWDWAGRFQWARRDCPRIPGWRSRRIAVRRRRFGTRSALHTTIKWKWLEIFRTKKYERVDWITRGDPTASYKKSINKIAH